MDKSISRKEFISLGALAIPLLALPFPLSSFAKNNTAMNDREFDVIIIGGSYAGLSAALTLGRSLRKTLVIDAGKPCNRQTPHSHNFLTQDGRPPQEISSIAKEQVSKYSTVKFYDGLATKAKSGPNGFEISSARGDVFSAKKLVFAAGIKDLLPEIDGFEACWGISVVHCPYCHGYEIRNQKTALMANGERAIHLASLVTNLTQDISILTSGAADFDERQLSKLQANNINIIDAKPIKIEHSDGHLKRIVFENGSTETFEAAYADVPFAQNTSLAADLGCKLTEPGHIEVDFMQKTSVPGIFACGDNSTPFRSVAMAVYGGNVVGAMINHELCQESF